ncbi:MAG: hypothetical protein HKN90_04485 [Flavobacteriaceae bacterium]|nr:hypothetical protein [Flavobacteriaceae bacterium]
MFAARYHIKIGIKNSLLLCACILLSCKEDEGIPNFSDDSNLRLKSIRSYSNSNPNQLFIISFNYDTNGKLINTQSNFFGSSTAVLKYDGTGKLVQVGDYEYIYNNENKIINIENDNLSVFSGTYEGTSIEYSDGKITSMTEKFSDGTTDRINTFNLTYNNRDQINSLFTTVKDVNADLNREYIIRLDKESYTYDVTGNIENIIREFDYESGNTPVFFINYGFDSYRNPAQLVLKTMGIEEENSLLFLRAISERSHFNTGPLFNYFSNNVVFYDQEPQTSDDNFVHYRFRISYQYNEFGYPVSAVETQTLVNRGEEFIDNMTWEYEEY